ncbi:MAG: hypothetical protein DYG83_14815 [Candidatus Brocadia sp. AMX2]|nr:hypothetical protein [Candidatus Brocadia sp.]MBL1170467.1 hypothetical protein [Candidatus Brocadia sp. AMX1]MCE7868063.1 hypothetical protein [Candidatus Brocadia sp. AMX2]MCQ3918800.1 hypothetical protein [Candidatus Brocadia sp.]RIJ89671.1 MAG: hypothetical protein DB853_14025 [Candidatus Brocadia sp.]
MHEKKYFVKLPYILLSGMSDNCQEGITFISIENTEKARDRSRTDNLIITNHIFVFFAIFYKWPEACPL